MDVRAYQGFLRVDLGGLNDHAYMDSGPLGATLRKRASERSQYKFQITREYSGGYDYSMTAIRTLCFDLPSAYSVNRRLEISSQLGWPDGCAVEGPRSAASGKISPRSRSRCDATSTVML